MNKKVEIGNNPTLLHNYLKRDQKASLAALTSFTEAG